MNTAPIKENTAPINKNAENKGGGQTKLPDYTPPHIYNILDVAHTIMRLSTDLLLSGTIRAIDIQIDDGGLSVAVIDINNKYYHWKSKKSTRNFREFVNTIIKKAEEDTIDKIVEQAYAR